jgi:hypothetical protein
MGAGTSTAERRRTRKPVFNGQQHSFYLNVYMFVVIVHWFEHIAQAVQVYALGIPAPDAGGLVGLGWPVLVTSEWMHYAYALFMIAGLVVLRHEFAGRARRWWNIALGVQAWHFFEHQILWLQAQTGSPWFGRPDVTSVAQLVVPRLELHLLYNIAVILPFLVAVGYHLVPNQDERELMRCSCAKAEPGR